VGQHAPSQGEISPVDDDDASVNATPTAVESQIVEGSERDSRGEESLQRYFREVSRWRLLSIDAERSVARCAAKGEPAAREEMVHRNLRLVVYWVKRYRASGLPIQDLIQEGNIGLMRAVDRFDPRKGTRFSTYASWWIRQALARAICDKQDIIRIPVHMHQNLRIIDRMLDSTGALHSPDVDIEATVDKFDIIPFKDWATTRRLQQSVSLDRRPDRDRDDPIDIEDHKAITPMHGVYLRELKEHITALLKELPRRHQSVLRLRFGLDGQEEHTLDSIGVRLHISRERVRQIQADAIVRLAGSALAATYAPSRDRHHKTSESNTKERFIQEPSPGTRRSSPIHRVDAAIGSRRARRSS
jgi:RNA polymerase primary sigma factor